MRVHFIGIGGYSMSGLAEVWRQRGFEVTGSDERPSGRTERLEKLGIPVFLGHRAEHVAGADLVVYTTDVPEDNPELTAARARGIPVRHRSELVAEFVNSTASVAVTGTHGKTTTTTLIAELLLAAGGDPTVLLGALHDDFGGSARLGRGDWTVAEADESDASFLRYHPQVAVITNVEPEHLDHYEGDFGRVVEAFRAFARGVRRGGHLFVAAEDPVARTIEAGPGVRRHTYGLGPEEADYLAVDVVVGEGGQEFTLVGAGERLGRFSLPLFGRHNVLNATAALGVAHVLGLPLDTAGAALARFRNAHRRFELLADVGGIRVVDDYAHHPTEIRAVLAAARQTRPGRLVVLFQPQRYARTSLLFDAFAASFDQADKVYIAEIYAPAGERPIPGVSGRALAEAVAARRGGGCRYVATLEEAERLLWEDLSPGDLVLTLGAGDVHRVAQRLAALLRRETAPTR